MGHAFILSSMDCTVANTAIQHKLKIFMWAFLWKTFQNKFVNLHTNLVTLINLDTNFCQSYFLKCKKLLDMSIAVDPAYHTRIRDGIAIDLKYTPSTMPTTCYGSWPSHPRLVDDLSNTQRDKQHSFQIPYNAWPQRCGRVETTEHLLCKCEYYLELLWYM